jgi:predicted ATP-grasp superfamily ATP-dependent carboligase
LHWVGFADFDLIEDPRDNRILVMEINPRVPACIKATMAAGVNWPEVIVNGCIGLPQKEYHYKSKVVLRHLGLDVMWFLKSDSRWKTKPSWFSFLGKNVYYQDMNGWSDIMPFIKGTFKNIKNILNPNFKKSKGLV